MLGVGEMWVTTRVFHVLAACVLRGVHMGCL